VSWTPHLLSFATGFLSLSQEILWIRLFGFANESVPQAFSFVLAAYLLGIALGARIGKAASMGAGNLWVVSGLVLSASAAFDLASPWLYGAVAHENLQKACAGLLVIITAALKAVVFPIAHHLGSDQTGDRVGRSMSRVYAFNIAGSALGPIVTGFVLLDRLTTQQCFAFAAMLTFFVGVLCLLRHWPARRIAALVTAGIALSGLAWALPDRLIHLVASDAGAIKRIVETRHGIVTVYEGGISGDAVYGGNVYDGRTNLDPVVNSNGIDRLLILAALQDHPRRVLMVGLSIGSWLKLVTSFPGVEQIDVIEINPGYLEAMKDYPRQASALRDARVRLHIDDGRRWLKGQRETRYDLVVVNNTLHWRAYASNLLSTEFLSEVKGHMAPGAILAYNSTGSPDVLGTASEVFGNAYRYESFVIASDHDFRPALRAQAAFDRLKGLMLDGAPLFPPGSEKVIRGFLDRDFIDVVQEEAIHARRLEIITDDNMLTEYRSGRRF
jgi:spermidine synthase